MIDGAWFDYKPGARVRRLGSDGAAGFYLLRMMDPGAVVPRDFHPERETFLVLEGEVVAVTWGDCSNLPFYETFRPETSMGPCATLSAEIASGVSHELRAHPERGALLLTVARPDFPAP